MATNMKEHLLEMINNKGWLAIDSLYFDNELVLNVSISAGRIGIIKSINSVVSFTSIDMLNTNVLNDGIIKYNNKNLGHGQALLVISLDNLQRYNLATYFKTSLLLKNGSLALPKAIVNVTAKDTYLADLDALIDGELETTAVDRAKINVAEIFEEGSISDVDGSYFNIDYLKEVWFKNKFDFNEKVSAYLNLLPGDLI